MFRGIELNSTVRGLVGMSILPGWSEVLNRDSGRMEPCTATLCPYATSVMHANGTTQLVNRAPYFGIGGE